MSRERGPGISRNGDYRTQSECHQREVGGVACNWLDIVRVARNYKAEITYVRVRPACAPQDDRNSSLVSAVEDIVDMRNSRLSLGLPLSVYREKVACRSI
jgi:hypothetical protein